MSITELVVPAALCPRDGRFGSGPSKVRVEALAALAATGTSYLGTSHRREGVRSVVRRIREAVGELLGLPDGYEVVLGNGGASQFWDIATCCLIQERSAHLVHGEFSTKFAAAVTAAPFLADPLVTRADAGSLPVFGDVTGADALCWPHNETSTGVMAPVVRHPGADDGALTVVDGTSGMGGLPVDVTQTDAYYFAPQKALAADGGLWLATLSPAAVERAQRLVADRWVPASLDLALAITQSRLDQTLNTPALATLFLVADQLDWLVAHGGLDWAVGRTTDTSNRLYRWAQASAYASPFVTDPAARSLVVGTVRFDKTVDADDVTTVLRRSDIVDVEAYRAAGYNGIRVGMFPAVDPEDVSALTRCVDWIVERLSG